MTAAAQATPVFSFAMAAAKLCAAAVCTAKPAAAQSTFNSVRLHSSAQLEQTTTQICCMKSNVASHKAGSSGKELTGC